jgi:hypothetical protein
MTETDISKVLIEGEYATIMGVKYKRVEPPKPPTLYDALYAEGRMHSFVCDTVCEIVKKWLPDEVEYEENELGYNQGWNDCLEEIRENLR